MLLCVLLASALSTTALAAEDGKVLKLAFTDSPTLVIGDMTIYHPSYAAMLAFKGAFEKSTGGEYSVELYPNGVLGFFSDHGLMWREEGEGRLYPLANKATSVLDCLRAACAAAGVEERVECEIAAVEPPRAEGSPFTLRLADGRFERAGAVIVAVGGAIARGLLPEGVPFREPEPTLGPLATEPRWPRRLDNIRVRGALELWRPDSRGMDGRALNDGGFPMGTHEGERLVLLHVLAMKSLS